MSFVDRICCRCKKPKGTLAYRWQGENETKRDYFHPACFKKFLESVTKPKERRLKGRKYREK